MMCTRQLASLVVWSYLAVGTAGGLVGRGSTVVCDPIHASMQVENGTAVTEYNCTGSGDGVAAVLNGEVDFAATDSVPDRGQFEAYDDLQLVPLTVSPIAVVYNVPGVRTLVLSREVLVKIFTGGITHWDDTEILFHNNNTPLPHQPILPVIRADKSGSTEIFTRSLHNFSPTLWEYNGTSTWPYPIVPPLTAKVSDTALLDFIEATPYTITYHGLDGVTAKGLSFVVLKNQIGKPTLPGWSDGDMTAAGFRFDDKTLLCDLEEGLGYPITGISYILFRTRSEKACEVVSWLRWLMVSPAVDDAISKSGLVPVAKNTRNQAASVLSDVNCGSAKIFGEELVVGTLKNSYDERLMNTLAYRFSVNRGSDRLVKVMHYDGVGHPVAVMQRHGIDIDGYLNFEVGLEGVDIGVNFGIEIAAMELSLDTITKVLTREISSWADPRLRERSTFLPAQNSSIIIAAEVDNLYYHVVLRSLGLSPDSVPPPDILFANSDALAEYIRTTPGVFGCLRSAFIDEWGLPKVQPVVDGEPTARYDDIGSASKAPHPFYKVWGLTVQENVVYKDKSDCKTVGRVHYDFLQYALGVEGLDAIKSGGVLIDDARVETAKSTLLGQLKCNGEVLMPQSSKFNMVIVIAGGAVVSALTCIVIVCLIWHWQTERKKRHEMLAENIYAAQHISEALVAFDLESAASVLSYCHLPPQLHAAFTSLLANLHSYKAYLPESCLQGADDIIGSSPLSTVITVNTTTTGRGHESGSEGSGSVPNKPLRPTRSDLRNKRVTLAVVNLVKLQEMPDLKDVLLRYLNVVVKATADSSGIRDGFSGDKVYMSWNGAKACVNQVQNSCRCVTIIQAGCDKERLSTTAGVSSGHVLSDVMGTDKMKRFTMIGGVVSWVNVLERLNKVYETTLLVDMPDVRNHFYVYTVDRVHFPKFKRDVFDILGLGDEKFATNEEWMYQLRDSEAQDPHHQYNHAMADYFMGDLPAAKDRLLSLQSRSPRTTRVLQGIDLMMERNATPEPVASLSFAYF